MSVPSTEDLQIQIASLSHKNERLANTLRQARDQLTDLRAQLQEMAGPPNSYATFLAAADGYADVLASGRRLRVAVSPEVNLDDLQTGQRVLMSEAMALVASLGYEEHGELATVTEVLEDGRIVVAGRGEDLRVVLPSGQLDQTTLRVGDELLVEPRAGIAYEAIDRSRAEDLMLEEVPEVEYSDIGGLGDQIEEIQDAVELPFLHPQLYSEHALSAPKGVLLYGPPGCGKTLIAKAVARSLARVAGSKRRAAFINVKGPELLNKYVGETERQIRRIFERARERASAGDAVVVFFDEMESLFRTRGTGVSSDVETTIVPQLLAEIDGVERLDNVIVIGASNREDMIDPAILRPGRLDVKIKIERPDAQAARDIFAKYLTPDLPIRYDALEEAHGDPGAAIASMIERTVSRMYSVDLDHQFLEVTYASGDKEILYFKDFASGAMINNIVDRAKKAAIKDLLSSGVRGIAHTHLLAACEAEFAENEDLPNTTNPDDWARVSGKKGERIVFIRTITQGRTGGASRQIEI